MAKTALDRHLERIGSLKGAALGIYMLAWREHKQHQWILEHLAYRIWDNEHYRKLPHWGREEGTGYADALLDVTLCHILEWRVNYAGKYIDGSAVPKGEWDKVKPGHHFYPGTDIPFSPIEEET